MEELKELAYILTKYKTKSIEIIGDDSRQYDSKLYQFYQAVQKGEVQTDSQAAFAIYGEENISGKYRNLKHELKTRGSQRLKPNSDHINHHQYEVDYQKL